MRADEFLVIVGASARAAAFSALRAGLRPWCADLFADLDLQARCPVHAVAPADYPEGILRVLRDAPPGPVLYTGALENRPELIRRLARTRPVWGNPAAVLKQVRSPFRVGAVLREHGLPYPAVIRPSRPDVGEGRWLIKPLRSAGGVGIRFWQGASAPGRGAYLQQYLRGDSVAALFVGDGKQAYLLGVTQQLVGESWLHAAPFHYCGSVGPLPLTPQLRSAFLRTGSVLAEAFGLRGLFGVDAVLHEGVPYPVEINPRYTASVEVLEYATGQAALFRHCALFGAAPAEAFAAPRQTQVCVIGKAIYFAPRTVVFPAEGPWQATLCQAAPVTELPAFADIPAPGAEIGRGRPVLTLLVRADDPSTCLDQLRRKARRIDRVLG